MHKDFHCDDAQRFKEELVDFDWSSCDYSPLHAAAASGNLDALEAAISDCKAHGHSIDQHFEWLEHGGEVGATGSALTEALLYGNLNGAKRLVDEGAAIDTDAMQLHGINYPAHMYESHYITPLELAFRQDKALFQKMLSITPTIDHVSADESCLFSRAVDSMNIELLTAIHREFPLSMQECYHYDTGFRGPITNCAALNALNAPKSQRAKRLAFLQDVAQMAKFVIEPDLDDGDEFQIHHLLLAINDSTLLASCNLQHMVDRQEVDQTNETRQVLEEARCCGVRNITEFYWSIKLATELLHDMDVPYLVLDNPLLDKLVDTKSPSEDDTLELYKALHQLCNAQSLDDAYAVEPVWLYACDLLREVLEEISELKEARLTGHELVNALLPDVVDILERLVRPSRNQFQEVEVEEAALAVDFEFLIAMTRHAETLSQRDD
ncbi:hypothetical protein [Vreelandella profundi]|uniref:hypothetical protein n=1 Tax=Vreelandella profundi TaxID=2852117 RepID=UPI001F2D11A3|nr:hypothetical protein [Halomonas profundi]